MEKVGWLSVTADGIELSNFGRHNGETAKSRALTAKRVAKHKANAKDNEEGNGKGNAATVTAPLPKEEKRREEIKTTVPNGTDAGASQIADGIDAKDAIWQIAVPWLIERHVPDKSARSLMGAAVKVLDEGGAWALCQRMMDERPMEPAAWLAAALNAQAKVGAPGKGGRPMNKQEALEARNRQIAMEAVAEISGGLGQ
ncbi:MAG TPA: hypothetical protein VJQ82_09900 [Terriglobales bacterium]|nr:hypothetical protein [Terriglobales bacterium]